ncbi:MAG: hypothetical protein JSR18_15495 [Proteobacteria bacterium]|nr:hypothetical protein [Pseudomonadota bacterium]
MAELPRLARSQAGGPVLIAIGEVCDVLPAVTGGLATAETASSPDLLRATG